MNMNMNMNIKFIQCDKAQLKIGERYLYIEKNNSFGYGNYKNTFIENNDYRLILTNCTFNNFYTLLLSTIYIEKLYKIVFINLPKEIEQIIKSYL